MIIVRLIGGLGNQLFQYALGRHLSEIYKTDLLIDKTSLENYKSRWYNKYSLSPFYKNPSLFHKCYLGEFNIKESYISSGELKDLFDSTYLCEDFHHKIKLVKEKKVFLHDPDVLRSGNHVYLHGYWQTEKYFVSIKDLILREYTLKNPCTGKNLEIKNQINSCESVSIHIRQGYAEVAGNSLYYPYYSSNYYSKCIDQIIRKVNNPHFFIFSDNYEWVHKNFKIPYPSTYVDYNNRDGCFEDLRLMSLCKHNIIANSTFSWWAAWLNTNSNKIVLSPKQWFLDKNYLVLDDLFPEKWIKI